MALRMVFDVLEVKQRGSLRVSVFHCFDSLFSFYRLIGTTVRKLNCYSNFISANFTGSPWFASCCAHADTSCLVKLVIIHPPTLDVYALPTTIRFVNERVDRWCHVRRERILFFLLFIAAPSRTLKHFRDGFLACDTFYDSSRSTPAGRTLDV